MGRFVRGFLMVLMSIGEGGDGGQRVSSGSLRMELTSLGTGLSVESVSEGQMSLLAESRVFFLGVCGGVDREDSALSSIDDRG